MRNLIVMFALLFPCVTQSQIINTFLSENFNAISELPAGWDQEVVSSDGGWIIGTAAELSTDGLPMDGADGNVICVNDDVCLPCDNSNTFLILESVNLSTTSNASLLFDIFYFDQSYSSGENIESLYLEVSIDGGNSWTEILEFPANDLDSWQPKIQDLQDYVGESDVRIGFRYSDYGDWMFGAALDNISIVEFDPNAVDAVIAGTTAGVFIPQVPMYYPDYTVAATGKEILPSLTIRNNAVAVIESFDATYIHNGQSFTENISGISVLGGELYTHIFSEATIAVTGANDFAFEISNVNGPGIEAVTNNNTGELYSVEGLDLQPGRVVVYEETAVNMSDIAVRGHVYFPYLQEKYPENFAPIAVHANSPMQNGNYVYDLSDGVVWWSKVYSDRQGDVGYDYDVVLMEETIIQRASVLPQVQVSNTLEIIFGSIAHVTSNIQFTDNMSGNYNVAVVLIEDSVVGTDSGYDQENGVYGNDYNGLMGGFEEFGWIIPAESMVYNRVARTIYPSFEGEQGIIPTSPMAGTSITYTVDLDLFGSWEQENLRAVTLIISNTTGRIVNAGYFNNPLNVQEVDRSEKLVQLYPNPAADLAFLKINSSGLKEIVLQVFDANGKLVVDECYKGVQRGDIIQMNTQKLENGLYTVKLNGGDVVAHQKLMVHR
jgi:hypothetical protein